MSMNRDQESPRPHYRMEFDIGTIKHLGLQMYSTLPPVIGELVANGWDANATRVNIHIPEEPIAPDDSEIVIEDNGIGMSDEDIRRKYMVVGRDRRDDDGSDLTPFPHYRRVMGRKGIGKFSAFGIAREIDVESAKDGEVSHFAISYDELLRNAHKRVIEFPPLDSTGNVSQGSRIRLRHITKFRTRRISIDLIRRGLARRFAVIGGKNDFEVVINGVPISPEDRDLKRLLDRDADDKPYLWEFEDEEIKPETGWTVSGWIGALNRTAPDLDGIDRGIVLMARGKMVQEPFIFEAVVGQQYALSYLIGELHAEFVDEMEDTVGTTRNSLVWDTEANTALKQWGRKEVNRIAREWSDKRHRDNELELQENPLYVEFKEQAEKIGNNRVMRIADKLVRQAIDKNPTANVGQLEPVIQTCLDFMEFDAFLEIAEDLTEANLVQAEKIFELFREWQIVEAKEMARITEGRIKTIEKLQSLIENNALEVPTLHNFLKEFPWIIDLRWTLVDDEVHYSDLLRREFPEEANTLESDKRIDFLCVGDGTRLSVVEIKRPGLKASEKQLDQIERYVNFMRDYCRRTSDPEYGYKEISGYLLCGGSVDTYQVREKRLNLENSQIYVRQYTELLSTVRRAHNDFLRRYDQLREAKQKDRNPNPAGRT